MFQRVLNQNIQNLNNICQKGQKIYLPIILSLVKEFIANTKSIEKSFRINSTRLREQMLTDTQLSSLMNTHIYLFRDDIQANAHPNLFHPLNQQYHDNSHSNQPTQQKPQLKIDIWKVNNTINPNQEYIGPIISFQRRQIWSKHNKHLNQLHQTQHQSHSKPIRQQYSQKPQLTDLSITVPNPMTNQKRNAYQSRHSSISKHQNAHHRPLFSTVKPYPLNQLHINPDQTPQLKYQNQNIITNSKIRDQQPRKNNFFINQSEKNSRIKDSQGKRRHKIFSLSSKASAQKGQYKGQSEIKRDIEEKVYLENKFFKNRKGIDEKVSTFTQQSRQQSAKITQLEKNQVNIMQRYQQPLKVNSIPQRIPQNEYAQDRVKFDLSIKQTESKEHKIINQNITQDKGSHISITNHFTTIPNTNIKQKIKPRVNSQTKALIQTDYVPSPSQLSTILKTIEKQSREVKGTRKTIQNRKSVYLKKLNQSIRYHEQNFDQSSQPSPNHMVNYQLGQIDNMKGKLAGDTKSQLMGQPSLIDNLESQVEHGRLKEKGHKNEFEQFIAIDRRQFEPHLVSLDNPVKVKFSYLDPKSLKYQF